jgi:aryl-alcohol dehydrogenase-like predicted oxidoreductase
MEYRPLGTAGIKVSAVGLGGNTFGRFIDEAGSIAVIHRAMELGINHIDTANVYANGVSETFVGKAVAGRRDEVVIATKARIRMGEGPNDEGLSRGHLIRQCEASLRRLNTDYVDLYYCHAPDPSTRIEETLRALDDLIRAGKIRYAACSNFPAWQICRALWVADVHHLSPFVVVQSRYNILDRELAREVVPFCAWSGVGIIPYSPLAGGFLTGKYRRGQDFEPGTRGYNNPNFQRFLTDKNWRIVERLEAWSEAQGHTPGELAVAWLLAHPEVPSVIAGATRPEQIEANVRAADWQLTPEQLAEIERICEEA